MNNKTRNTVLQEIKITSEGELLAYLVDAKVRKSRNAIKSLLVHKQIKVNGKVITQHNHPLKTGDKVTIHKHDHKLDEKKLKGLTIVYEDKDLIVIDKESGLLPVSTGKEGLKETAYNIVSTYLKAKSSQIRPYIMFRLDRETSGLMVFTKDPELQTKLQKEWILHPPKRTYQAIVEGPIEPKSGTITSWLTENKNFVVFASEKDNGGLKAVVNYDTEKSNNRYTLLTLTPDTSRKNQLRVQLQSIGHPIVGDKKYGSKISPIRRIALHANILSFKHPQTGELLELISPLPKKMQVMVDAINTPDTQIEKE